LNVEKGGRGKAYNNLVVNCRFGTRVVDDADVTNLAIGYNHYYGTDAVMVNEFYPTATKFKKGDSETSKDLVGAAKENDPTFANYTVSGYLSTYPVDPLSLDFMPANVDFRLKAGGTGLTKGKTGFTTKADVTVNGVKYTTPAPAAFIGTYGTN
jgi:hypothetical protein